MEAYLLSKKGNQPKTFQSNYTKPGISYVNVTKNQQTDQHNFNELAKEVKKIKRKLQHKANDSSDKRGECQNERGHLGQPWIN